MYTGYVLFLNLECESQASGSVKCSHAQLYNVLRSRRPGAEEQAKINPLSKQLLSDWKKLEVTDNVLYRVTNDPKQLEGRRQLVLPYGLHQEVLQELHDKFGHMGADRTHEATRQRYFWPKMSAQVQLDRCAACQRCCLRKQGEKASGPGFYG